MSFQRLPSSSTVKPLSICGWIWYALSMPNSVSNTIMP